MKKAPRRHHATGRAGASTTYDFQGGVRGKHHKAYQRGHTVKIRKTDGTTVVQHFRLAEGAVVLEPDVQRFFPDSKAVNKALRSLIALIPSERPRTART
ncbi:MAG: hypothetical protein HY721_07110 [Planctomycetes bacterium]|nr:hypothetical protein [Planctomycetota bacterium]